MRILNIKIRDFRNIVSADIDLGKLNILTGKNSSGKTNFLLALSSSLSQDKDYSEHFSNNAVTIHPGKGSTSIVTTVGDINSEICYISDEKKFICISPNAFTFEKVIGKNCLSKMHRLYFSGRFYVNDGDQDVQWSSFDDKRDELYKEAKDELVYEESFVKDIERDGTKIVKVSKTPLSHQDEYLRFFSVSNVISWMGKNADDIHCFVTEKGSREIQEQVVERIKPRTQDTLRQQFDRSKFIFLLADLHRNPNQYKNFKSDLKIYTGGIVTDIYISEKGSNKGEMNIESPNGPSDIWTISRGTSILLFFILLLNWVKLPEKQKSYSTPNIMVFDEIDSLMHPSLMPQFKELLESISEKIQLFMSTHSPYFIDGFDREQLLLLKDTPSLSGSKKVTANRCNIYNYATIIKRLANDAAIFSEKKNSELFVDGLIDSLFPSESV